MGVLRHPAYTWVPGFLGVPARRDPADPPLGVPRLLALHEALECPALGDGLKVPVDLDGAPREGGSGLSISRLVADVDLCCEPPW